MQLAAPTRFVVFLIFVLGASVAMASIFGKSSLGKPWNELFSNVVKLNEHFKLGKKATIRDVRIENYDLSGAHFEDASFENTEWRNVIARNAIFKNTVFNKCKMERLELEQSTFENVTFQDCELTDVSFFESKLPGVKFINCKLADETTFQKSSHGDLLFDHVTMNNVAFFQAQAKIFVRDSKLDRVKFNAMPSPSALTFEKSELNEVDLSRSQLNELQLLDVKSQKSGIRNGTIERVNIVGGRVRFGLSESSIGQLDVRESQIGALSLDTVVLKRMTLVDCLSADGIELYEAHVGSLRIENCALRKFSTTDASVDIFEAKNSQFADSEFSNMKSKKLTFDGISLGGKADFTNAQFGSLNITGLVRRPDLRLITAGSNVILD